LSNEGFLIHPFVSFMTLIRPVIFSAAMPLANNDKQEVYDFFVKKIQNDNTSNITPPTPSDKVKIQVDSRSTH
jgi:hypothetical protein